MMIRSVIYGFFAIGALTAFAQSDADVRKAQELLKQKGYYSGLVDGVNGPSTKKAVSAYQKDQGLPETGKLDEKTTGRLNSGTPTEAGGTVTGAVKQAGSSASSTVPNAVKEAGSSAKSETSSAFGEIKSVFGGGKKKTAKPTVSDKAEEKK